MQCGKDRTVMAQAIIRSILILSFFALYCEYLHYFVVLLFCTWPPISSDSHDHHVPTALKDDLKAMFLADTHLLGSRDGHWFDKLRREWQMKRSFQTAMAIHRPDIVFVLGDLFDEGKWCDDDEFQYHASRFRSMFAVPEGTDLYVVAGNHDEGFHYMMTDHKHKRFEQEFHSPSVQLVMKKDAVFVLLNSMAMEGDHCHICAEAERDLHNVSKFLTTLQNCHHEEKPTGICQKYSKFYSKPILLQHFPMYRPSDADCNTVDSAPVSEKYIPFKEKYDCLDKRSTDLLLNLLKPRLVVVGHTHHGCFRILPGEVPEWTVSSFSWRNRNNPTFLLIRFSEGEHSISKCFLPEESTVINIYIFGCVCAVLNILVSSLKIKSLYRKKLF
ncbi:hypothetical protein EGW08_021641 [Elysia chlorotica]|uniref:Calcineurin-like phosphoesterase domain-containing protein n=1 Tax=Elysia chlorotica TaxID=188477 RepID=A0A3S1AX61_ELYCH|nr:hypothetical protein EGW08_021641 [Elysia chlorotica]